MPLKIIGVGFGRTGTLSLKTALQELGFGPCYHMEDMFRNEDDVDSWLKALKGDKVDWQQLFSDYQSSVDFPGCVYFEQLATAFPDAQFILTVRDPEKWYESAYRTIFTARPRVSSILKVLVSLPFSKKARKIFRCALHNKGLLFDGVFKCGVKNRDEVMEVFNHHNKAVKAAIPEEKLLIYEVKEGWGPLCEFLGVPVPETEFPRINQSEDFETKMVKQLFEL